MPSAAETALPEGVHRGNELLLRLTESAGVKGRALLDREPEGSYLRVAITGGGCNGLSYSLSFRQETKRGDIFVFSQGVPVLIDPKSALYLKGSVLNYSDSLTEGGFKFENPNAQGSCSCGESFNL